MTFKEFMKEVGYDPMTTFWGRFQHSRQVWYSRCQGYLQTCIQ